MPTNFSNDQIKATSSRYQNETVRHDTMSSASAHDACHIVIVSPSAITHVEKSIRSCRDEIRNIGKPQALRECKFFAQKWLISLGGLLLGIGFFALFIIMDEFSCNSVKTAQQDEHLKQDTASVNLQIARFSQPAEPIPTIYESQNQFPAYQPQLPPIHVFSMDSVATLPPPTPQQVIANDLEPKTATPTPPPQENQILFDAEQLFQQAVQSLTRNPMQSMVYALKCVQKFAEFSQEIPSHARWVLNQSVAAQDLGMALNGFRGGIQTLTTSEDGQWLMFCTTEGQIWIWDAHKYDKTTSGYLLDTVPEGVSKLCFTSDLGWAIAVTAKGTLLFWDMSLAQPAESLIRWTVPAFVYTDLVVSRDAKWMAGIGQPSQEYSSMISSQSDQNMIHLFNLNMLTQNRQISAPTQLNSHQKPIQSFTISRDSRWLILGSEDSTISLYDLHAPVPRSTEIVLTNGGIRPVSHVATSADSQWLIVVDDEGTVKIWNLGDIQKTSHPYIFCENRMEVTSIAMSDNNQWLAIGSADHSLNIWKWNPGLIAEPVFRLSGHLGAIQSLQFSHKNDSIVSWGQDNEVRIWDLTHSNPEEQVLVFKSQHSIPLSSVVLTSDERWLILGQKSYSPADSLHGLRLWPMNFDEVFPCALLYSRQYQTLNTPFFEQETVNQARSVQHHQSVSR